MKFQLLGDWGSIEAGTIIDGHDPQWSIETSGPGIGGPFPLNAKALDQEALDSLAYWYGEENYHLLYYSRGLRLPALHFPPPPPTRKDTSL
jgi:hypothetical protein